MNKQSLRGRQEDGALLHHLQIIHRCSPIIPAAFSYMNTQLAK